MYYRMSGVLYHRVIHGLGLFICLEALYRGNACGVTWVFDQSENTRSILFHIALASSERLIFKVEILASISQPSTLVLALHSVLIKKGHALPLGRLLYGRYSPCINIESGYMLSRKRLSIQYTGLLPHIIENNMS